MIDDPVRVESKVNCVELGKNYVVVTPVQETLPKAFSSKLLQHSPVEIGASVTQHKHSSSKQGKPEHMINVI